MLKKILIYLFCFNLIFFPYQKANAIVPVAIAYAIDYAATTAVRYVSSEVVFSTISKAVTSSNAYFAGTSTLSSSNLLKYAKVKHALGVAGMTALLSALDYVMDDDGVFHESIEASPDQIPIAGYYWQSGSHIGGTAYSVAMESCDDLGSCYSIQSKSSRYDTYHYYRVSESGDIVSGTGLSSYKIACDATGASVFTCGSGYVVGDYTAFGEAVSDDVVADSLLDYVSGMDEDEFLSLVADGDGVIDDELQPLLESSEPPVMPDGTSIPNIGDPSWNNANNIANGTAQSYDSSADNYVSSDNWDEAYYLSNDVANNNTDITSSNAGIGSSVGSASGADTSTSSDTNVSVDVDVSGIEQRLDIGNETTSSMLTELERLNTTTIESTVAPDKNAAQSFWDAKYPDGIAGLFNDFMEQMKTTSVYIWLSSFNTNLGSGEIPVYSACFNNIASIDFGCYDLQADSYIWLTIKAGLILTAVIFSRKIVFGG